MMTKTRLLMTFGLLLLLLGIILPFLMVIRAIEPTFFLIFFSSGASTVGLALGMVGLTQWSVKSIKKKPQLEYTDEGEWMQSE
ncbi:MAG: hypothetical protein HYU84_07280 [Chloroflexi bacterium]|nr:hypothetical protein [Chloroflexota bacterium]MBI3169501.1 hypothetical protein [Chloroflexota bacterium]